MRNNIKPDHQIRVLFVCHGNICRSAMAEAMFKEMLRKRGWEDCFYVDSAATSDEEIGNPMYPPAVRKLKAEGIPVGNHRARQMTKKDYQTFDYLLCMDDRNLGNMYRIIGGDPDGKIRKLLYYCAGDPENASGQEVVFGKSAGGKSAGENSADGKITAGKAAAGMTAVRNIADPWFTGNFDDTYRDLTRGLDAFLSFLAKKERL